METLAKPIPRQAIAHTLDLIESCDKKMILLKERGIGEERLEMRQQRHLRAKHVKELERILKRAHLTPDGV
ncbi:MAG: hypothetical protein AAF740_03890 [Bacteroidota bacterium]